MNTADSNGWHKTACILCAVNCGIEVQTNGTDRRIDQDPRRQGAPGLAGLRLREGAAPRPLPERRRPPDLAAAPPRRRQLRGDRLGHRDPRGRRRARGRSATRTAARRSSTTAAAARATTSAAPTATARSKALGVRYRSNALAQEKTGEFWVDGQCSAAARTATSSTRGRGVRRQEPVAVARLPARARRSLREIAKDPNAHADRHRPAAQRDRRARRLPPAGAARAPTPGASPRWLAILVQEDLVDARIARRARRRASTRSLPRCARSRSRATARVLRRRRGAAARRPRGASRRPRSVSMLRGPRRPDDAALARWSATWSSWSGCSPGNFGSPAPATLRAHPVAREASKGERRRSARHRARAPQPGDRRADHQRPDPVQRDPRGDPDRPPGALPRDARRERQPGALARRQPAHARRRCARSNSSS